MELSRQKEIGIALVASVVTFVTALLVGAPTVDLNATLGLSWSAAIAALLWAAVVSVALMLMYAWRPGRVTVALVGAASVLLASRMSFAGFIGGGFLALFIFAAGEHIAQKVGERILLQLRFVILPGIGLLIAGIAISAFTLSVPALQEAAQDGRFGVTADFTRAVLAPATPVLSGVLPGYTPTMTVDDFIRAQATQQLGVTGSSLTERDLAQARAEFSRSLGIPLEGSETVPEIAASYANDFLQRITAGNSVVAIVVLAAAALLAIRAAVPLLSWIPLALAHALLWVCKKSGLISITTVQVDAQKISL